MKRDPKLISHDEPSTAWNEAYRGIRTNIEYVKAVHDLRTLLVTSAIPEAGKSLTVANLATVMAQSGSRTVVVDADLRRPAQHKIFRLPNLQGYTTVIAKGLNILSVLHKGPVDHLSVLTSGPLPPNPADLLESTTCVELLQTLRQHFDWVLVDAPPVLGLADAAILGRQMDGVLYVIKSGFKSRRADQKALQLLRQTGSRVIGVVLNQVKDLDRDLHAHYGKH